MKVVGSLQCWHPGTLDAGVLSKTHWEKWHAEELLALT